MITVYRFGKLLDCVGRTLPDIAGHCRTLPDIADMECVAEFVSLEWFTIAVLTCRVVFFRCMENSLSTRSRLSFHMAMAMARFTSTAAAEPAPGRRAWDLGPKGVAVAVRKVSGTMGLQGGGPCWWLAVGDRP